MLNADFLENLKKMACELIPLNRYALSEEMHYTLEQLRYFLKNVKNVKTSLLKYPTGKKFNHWEIGHKWQVKKATISTLEGQCLIDLTSHPLKVILYSSSTKQIMHKRDLENFVFYKEDDPDLIPYIFRQQYRFWEKQWGISLSFNEWMTLPDKELLVEIETEETNGHLELLEATLEGESDDTILFCTHVCHPAQANDGFSGAVFALYVLNKLIQKSDHRFTYKIIFTTEVLGPIAYLHDRPKLQKRIKQVICPSWLGLDSPPAYSLSRRVTKLDKIIESVMKKNFNTPYKIFQYLEHSVGDEPVFDTPGIEIPTSCFQRVHIGQNKYHTSWDSVDRMSFDGIFELGDALSEALDINEMDMIPTRKFTGLPCLASPDLNLYIEPPYINNLKNPLFDPKRSLEEVDEDSLRKFRGLFLFDIDQQQSIFQIATKYNIPFSFLRDYFFDFKKKGLIDLKPA